MNRTIILVGFMGSGKTSIARLLGKHYNMRVIDIDYEIEKSEGLTISQIFKEKGEAYFRELESSFLHTNSFDNSIVATGGGLPCFKDNMDVLNKLGITFYLKILPKEVRRRVLKSNNKRPLLSTFKTEGELLMFIEETLRNREVFYHQAQHHIDASDLNKEDVLAKVVKELT